MKIHTSLGVVISGRHLFRTISIHTQAIVKIQSPNNILSLQLNKAASASHYTSQDRDKNNLILEIGTTNKPTINQVSADTPVNSPTNEQNNMKLNSIKLVKW